MGVVVGVVRVSPGVGILAAAWTGPSSQCGLHCNTFNRRGGGAMAASRMIQANVPGDIPDRANEIIEAPGLTVSDATRIAQDRRIPPELFQPNAETLAAFAEIDRGGLKRFDSVDELMANLNAED